MAQFERMNGTIKEATVKRFHDDSHGRLRAHVADVLAAYNFARRLKTLNDLTHYDYIARSGLQSPIDSSLIRSIKWRD